MRVTITKISTEPERLPFERGLVVDFEGVPWLLLRPEGHWPGDGWRALRLDTWGEGILLSSEGTILGRATAIEITVEDA